jgi:hypothetical protein
MTIFGLRVHLGLVKLHKIGNTENSSNLMLLSF